jgi:hypothetical protein
MINIGLCMGNDKLVNPLTRRTRMSQRTGVKSSLYLEQQLRKPRYMINISLLINNDHLVNVQTHRTRMCVRTGEIRSMHRKKPNSSGHHIETHYP